MKKVALITGVFGQDGTYLAKFLLEKNYQVVGLYRKQTEKNTENTDFFGITNLIKLVAGDICDEEGLASILEKFQPSEVYNLAAQSFVGSSWEEAKTTTEVNALGVLNLLRAIKKVCPKAKFYQASTGEMFGNCHINGLQTEETPFHPCSPYAVSKLYGYWITNNFKESYGMFCANGILYNHESPIRNIRFVTRKISDGVARIKLKIADEIRLGNLDSQRDWGFAGDYVEAMWLMLQQESPDNFIISTGQNHSIRDFLEVAFSYVDIPDWKKHITIDSQFQRPTELLVLEGKSDKAQRILDWQPRVKFEELVKMMVDADLKRLSQVAFS